MKKASLALAVLAASTSAAWAQSSVTLYGIMDAGIRYTSNANAGQSQRQLIPGGMSQSRLGFNVTEDMGGGMKALANLEHRLASDTGNGASANFWQQSWVGLQTGAGIVRLGRQYNVLFDAYSATLASFKYSPFAEIYKPEVGMTLGARQDNMVKYSFATGGLSGSVQLSAGEGSSNNKSAGGLLKYAAGPFAIVGAYLGVTENTTGKKATGTIIGATYTTGPLHFNAVYASNKFDTGTGLQTSLTNVFQAQLGGAVLNAAAADVSKRDMLQFGVTYQLTPQLNLGTSVWLVDQNPQKAGVAKSKGTLWAAIADYAFSKRTDAYLEVDSTSFNGAGVVRYANGASKRTGVTLGLRHRF